MDQIDLPLFLTAQKTQFCEWLEFLHLTRQERAVSYPQNRQTSQPLPPGFAAQIQHQFPELRERGSFLDRVLLAGLKPNDTLCRVH